METIESLYQKLRRHKISSVEITHKYLDKIKKSKLNAYINIYEDIAIKYAKQADAQIKKGNNNKLCGIPYALKDLFNFTGTKTTAASKILHNFISPFHATVSEKIINQGAVFLGKTNLDEFAMGSASDTSYYGPVHNPWHNNKIAGGSSGGSAAAVAADLCLFAMGTDTGGSVRQPASMCGITGIKPTYGRVSRYGIVAYASSLDQAGPLAKTAQDCALILNNISGFDDKDSTSSPIAQQDFTKDLDKSLLNLKIGVPKEYFTDGLDNKVALRINEAIKEYEKLGAKIKEISLPNIANSIAAYYVIASSEASSNLSRYDGVRYGHRANDIKNIEDLYIKSRSEGFGNETKKRIVVGTYALSEGYYDAYYLQAQKVRRLVALDFVKAFQSVDVIMGPVSPITAWDFNSMKNDVAMYLSDIYTLGVNLAGLPAMSVPCGLANDMPVGLHIIGKTWHESQLLNVAHKFQLATDFHLLSPN